MSQNQSHIKRSVVEQMATDAPSWAKLTLSFYRWGFCHWEKFSEVVDPLNTKMLNRPRQTGIQCSLHKLKFGSKFWINLARNNMKFIANEIEIHSNCKRNRTLSLALLLSVHMHGHKYPLLSTSWIQYGCTHEMHSRE